MEPGVVVLGLSGLHKIDSGHLVVNGRAHTARRPHFQPGKHVGVQDPGFGNVCDGCGLCCALNELIDIVLGHASSSLCRKQGAYGCSSFSVTLEARTHKSPFLIAFIYALTHSLTHSVYEENWYGSVVQSKALGPDCWVHGPLLPLSSYADLRNLLPVAQFLHL